MGIPGAGCPEDTCGCVGVKSVQVAGVASGADTASAAAQNQASI